MQPFPPDVGVCVSQLPLGGGQGTLPHAVPHMSFEIPDHRLSQVIKGAYDCNDK